MALEQDVQELTATIRELIVVLSATPPVAQEKPKAKKPAATTATPEVEEAPQQAEQEEVDLVGEAKGEDPQIYFDTVLIPAARALISGGNKAGVKSVLEKHNVAQITSLPKDIAVYKAVFADLEALNG